MAEQGKVQLFEKVLLGLVKLFKAVQYYPPGHPALQNLLEEVRAVFEPLLADGEAIKFSVRKEGFFFQDQQVSTRNPATEKLAPFLFSRRIQHLMVLADLSHEDLWSFARCLQMKPDEIRRLGGIAEVLFKARVSTIWVNELNLSQIFALKDKLENQKYDSPLPFDENSEQRLMEQVNPSLTDQQRKLLRIIQELRATHPDESYRKLLAELIPQVLQNLTPGGETLALEALALLTDNAFDQTRPIAQREASLQALGKLTKDNTLKLLLELLCDRNRDEETRRAAREVLRAASGNLLIWRLTDRLAEEPLAHNRKTLCELLISKGPAAQPVLFEYLCDARWHVVRNIVSILGDIRSPAAASRLRDCLSHEDVRVRWETVRALSRIGGDEALRVLLHPLQAASNLGLCRQVLLAIATLQNPLAVPELVRKLKSLRKNAANLELCKAIIKTLGDMGLIEAVPALTEILRHSPMWNRALMDEIRCSAAVALGQMDEESAREALRKATGDRSEAVARCALLALNTSPPWENS